MGAMTTTEADQSPLPENETAPAPPGPRHAADVAPEPTDENVWLEDIHGEEQLAWVREQNARTEELLEDAEYAAVEAGILEVLDSNDRIAMVSKRGDFYYNFWKDQEHPPKGLWRRTTWESYLTEEPEWDVLLDIDALAAAEGVEWVFHGVGFLRPADGSEYRLAIVSLSPPTAATLTATASSTSSPAPSWRVALTCRQPKATSAGWMPTLCLCPARRMGSPATTSSYARTGGVKLRRGQSLAQAERIFEIPRGPHVGHGGPRFHPRVMSGPSPWTTSTSTTGVRRCCVTTPGWLSMSPTDVNISAHRDWLLFRPQKDWDVAGVLYPAGSLLAADFESYLAGSRSLLVLFTPDAHTSLQSWSWTKDYLLLNLLRDVSSEIRVLDPARPDSEGGWASTVLDACPPLHDVNAYAVYDEDPGAEGNDFWLVATGFTTPTTLTRGTLVAGAASRHAEVKRSPSFFNEADYEVQQHFAVSDDGTKVPYFQVASKDLVLDGQNPTQLSGYGGFEVSRTPAYSGTIGRAWLERRTLGVSSDDGAAAHSRGGVFVVANIRGGGEYGPSWHRAALQENRHRAYEDFAAVAKDLISRGVTSRRRLGCVGGSNGGLLVGNMLTQYPELFGGAVSCGGAPPPGHAPLHQALRRILLDRRIR